ncbi:chemotaxis protein [Segetibacter sp. 3557_3]|uniref:chemotaxis protein CheB n=1 Tax=Segetibacter sp. 3557_3 TaxID=2547429 RepID=UPI001058ABA4|nr:chemotaxis protein CheB [Segetibacter sp. 3557_3]TDH25499.1 chemotaxis protein [Segetibacter sp. 3557_3]
MPNTKNKADEPIEADKYLVAIGASAGGLEAIHELFENMPPDTNFSFVIIQHLSPDYKSLMPELLAKHTQMQVFEAVDGMRLQPNCIYVLPSKKLMTVRNAKLVLTTKTGSNSPNTAIDTFFYSVAENHGKKAVAIILSGTGSDGTKGIEAIKNSGGIVIVQDPLTAKFDGMPNSAIATGVADLILSPDMIPEELSEFLKESPLVKSFNQANQKDEAVVNSILELVLTITSHDFRNYKRPTIYRRLVKRMALKNLSQINDYFRLLKEDSSEIKQLSKEFLIGVTKFFRDMEAFREIEKHAIDHAWKRASNGTLKVWVAACSTGEEAYSLAMLYQEMLERSQQQHIVVKIFATDIDQAALEIASRGVYGTHIENDVPRNYLEKYFKKEDNKYRVLPILRKMVVFAHHDILKDPPFSKLDLITCRNMLIYMSAELQKKVLRTFHFALNTEGTLVLGPSENVGNLKDYTIELNKKWKIYRNLEKSGTYSQEEFITPLDKFIYPQSATVSKAKNALHNLPEIFKETLVEEFNYAGIYIDRELEVKQAVGNFKQFLDFPENNFNFNLLKLVTPELSIALSTCVRKAIKTNERTSMKRVKIRTLNNKLRYVNIVVKPYLQQKAYLQPFLFVVLNEEPEDNVPAARLPDDPSSISPNKLSELEQELKETKLNLQVVVEELESSNEELQSSNEEMISANEELQSTNEELQSLNEELHTVNAEHQLKIKELVELNDDMNNYFRNTEIGQVLIDNKLIIRKFTPSAQKQINLIETDIGRSIVDISNNFERLDFTNNIKQVIKTGKLIEKEVTLTNGQIYQMRINQYIKLDQSVGGAVVTFVNISQIKQLNSIIEGIFNSSLNGILAFKAVRNEKNEIIDFEWLASNKAADKLIGVKERMNGKKLLKQFPFFDTNVFEEYVKVVQTGVGLHMEYPEKNTRNWYEIVAVKRADGLVITFSDITEKKNSYEHLKSTSDQLQSSNYELERSNYDLMQFASVASHDLKEPLRKIQTYGNLLNAKMHLQLKPGEKNYLEKIIKSSQRMQVLIDDVLTFSKLSNKQTHFTITDLNNVIDRIIDDLEIIIKEKNVQFHIDRLPNIEAIPGQMNQLFQNLISNALKFNRSPNPQISIHSNGISPEEEKALKIIAQDYIRFAVEDNGIGFEDRFKEKIFGIFQRLHSSNDYEGTGIGLAICKKIVENHHGFITVESTPEKGSKFIITFPLKSQFVED